MRRAARVDDNQKEIVTYARKIGMSVQHLHTVGNGCPDLILGYLGFNFLVEVKDGAKPPSKQKLTIDEVEWHKVWLGDVSIVKSTDDVDQIQERARIMANLMAELISSMKKGQKYRAEEISVVGRKISTAEKEKMLIMLSKTGIAEFNDGYYMRVK